jgi:hypothetical protein
MCDRVMFFLSLLAFKCDGNAIREFKVRVCVWDDFPILEKTNVPHAKLFRLTMFGLGGFQIFARSKCKEHAQSCQLDNHLVEFGDLLLG